MKARILFYILMLFSLQYPAAAQRYQETEACGLVHIDIYREIQRMGGFVDSNRKYKVGPGQWATEILLTSSRTTNPDIVWTNKQILNGRGLQNYAVYIFQNCSDISKVTFRTLEDGRSRSFPRY